MRDDPAGHPATFTIAELGAAVEVLMKARMIRHDWRRSTPSVQAEYGRAQDSFCRFSTPGSAAHIAIIVAEVLAIRLRQKPRSHRARSMQPLRDIDPAGAGRGVAICTDCFNACRHRESYRCRFGLTLD